MMLCFNGFSKAMLKGPRPYWLSDKVKTLDPTLETSYGFPSGHSTGMVAIYGVLVWHWGNPYLVGLWAVVSAAVMYSRVYTGTPCARVFLEGR
jgi:membrane-associated phospholipid phosphatase